MKENYSTRTSRMSAALPREPLAFMLRALKPYWFLTLCIITTVIAGASAESLQPYVIKLLVDTLSATSDIHASVFVHHAVLIGLGFLGLRLFIVAAWWFYNICRIRIEPPAEVAIREALLEHLFRHPYMWFLNSFSGRTAQRVDAVARSFREFFQLAADDLLYVFIRGVTILGLMAATDPWLGAGMLGWVILVSPVNAKLSGLIQRRTFEWITVCGRYTERIADICANIFSVRSNGGAMDTERSQCETIAEDIRFQHKRNVKTVRYISAARTNMNTLLYAALFSLSFWRWQTGHISLGDFAMTMSASILMVDILASFFKQSQQGSQMLGIMREGLEGLLTDVPSLRPERPSFRPGKGAIDFASVSFAYRPSAPVLHNFSLDIAAGEKVALVGPSGAGKSTLVSLLLSLWEATSGSIAIDGQNITAVDRESLLKHMAVIPQDTSLFHRSLYDNIVYGSTLADPASVEAAARAAHIHDFITSLPQGYDTHVGERGLKLSGGQRQRIAVARAIHKNAPILLLDEATSALDSESEHAIQDALHRLMPDKTVLAIAHRLSTIAHMDRIVFLESGRIVEQGSHAELLKLQGRYARLWNMQSGGYLPELASEVA